MRTQAAMVTSPTLRSDIHKESDVLTFEQELCRDVITLMTVFSARLYGKRSHQNKLAA